MTAVRGLGERLVSGEAMGDEWLVRERRGHGSSPAEQAVDRRQAVQVANEARRIADARGTPQDIEWAIDGEGTFWILQARPMTALPPEVSWEPPAPGAFTRQFRLGEWIGEPVTPLFESWLLSTMEERMHAWFFEQIGQRAPAPLHVVVNGWYFYSLNWFGPTAIIRNLPRMLWHLVRHPRRIAGINPSTVRHSFPIVEREWRADFRPRYRAAVQAAAGSGETVPVSELPALIDELAGLAGEAFGGSPPWPARRTRWSSTSPGSIGGTCARHAGRQPSAVAHGLRGPTQGRPRMRSFRWTGRIPRPRPDRRRRWPIMDGWSRQGTRPKPPPSARSSSSPRRLSAFRRLLADAQHLVPVREEQVGELTIAWPVMRRAVVRIGEALVARGLLDAADDVFFLSRDETLGALADGRPGLRRGCRGAARHPGGARPARAASPHRSGQPRS